MNIKLNKIEKENSVSTWHTNSSSNSAKFFLPIRASFQLVALQAGPSAAAPGQQPAHAVAEGGTVAGQLTCGSDLQLLQPEQPAVRRCGACWGGVGGVYPGGVAPEESN